MQLSNTLRSWINAVFPVIVERKKMISVLRILVFARPELESGHRLSMRPGLRANDFVHPLILQKRQINLLAAAEEDPYVYGTNKALGLSLSGT